MTEELLVEEQNILKESPIYNLSMCSLEDFYSNFLCWFLNLDIKNYIKIFFKNESNIANDYYAETQKRKGNNRFDIAIINKYNDDKIEYIIENKIKSYPTEKQVNQYVECFKSNKEDIPRILLLSLVDFNFEEKKDYLSFMMYGKLKDKIKQILPNIKDEYNKYLINDYLNVITIMSKYIPKETSTEYDFYEDNTNLEKLGLVDIYRKYRTSNLLMYLKSKISNELKNDIDFSNNIRYGDSYHNKRGTVDINVTLPKFGENSFIGIQIEGYQYRYVLNLTDKTLNAIDIAKKLNENNKSLWFLNCKDSRGRNHPNTGFCGYNESFIYKYKDIEKNAKYENIAKNIISDLTHIKDHYAEIINIIKNK